MEFMGDRVSLLETGRFVHTHDGAEDEEETRHRRAAESGDIASMSALGSLLLRRGDLDGAEPQLRAATAAGDRA
ncbi:MAG: sel1 repeat family protein, partial [Streptomyces sp.]|nr:sel1 repeat family protein [Streptomyces sp.]